MPQYDSKNNTFRKGSRFGGIGGMVAAKQNKRVICVACFLKTLDKLVAAVLNAGIRSFGLDLRLELCVILAYA